jgi:hypothetical protein
VSKTDCLFLIGAAALLVGCGGSQPPIGAPGAMPQVATMRARGGWPSGSVPETSNQDLLYVSQGKSVLIYTYPGLKRIGKLKGFDSGYGPYALCSDSKGDVFVTALRGDTYDGYVYEFAHGGKKPIAKLSNPGSGYGCAVDPTTGNLAVANYIAPGSHYYGNVAIYANAKGTPTVYTDPNIGAYFFAAYDDSGNLYVDGASRSNTFPLALMPKGSSVFTDVSVNQQFQPHSLQWYDGSLIIGSAGSCNCNQGPAYLYQVQMSGSTGTVVGVTTLDSHGKNEGTFQFYISGSQVVGPSRKLASLQVWSYPEGGNPIKTVTGAFPIRLTISVAPSR